MGQLLWIPKRIGILLWSQFLCAGPNKKCYYFQTHVQRQWSICSNHHYQQLLAWVILCLLSTTLPKSVNSLLILPTLLFLLRSLSSTLVLCLMDLLLLLTVMLLLLVPVEPSLDLLLTARIQMVPALNNSTEAQTKKTRYINFMKSIAYGTWNRANANSYVCRQYHSLFTPYRPEVWCPVIGKTGAGVCVDVPYNSFYAESF